MALSDEHRPSKDDPTPTNPTRDDQAGDDEIQQVPDDVVEDEVVDDNDDDDDDGEDDEEVEADESKLRTERDRLNNLLHRMSTGRVALRVHDVLIKGNTKTKDSVIEAEVEALKSASSMQELLQAAGMANARLQRLGCFDSVNITLDSGPPELPHTANVVVEVTETKRPLTGEIGMFTKPEARSWSLEGSLKLKNLFGHGDMWDGSLAYGWDQTSELSAGVSLPRVKGFETPLLARVSLLSQDWMKFSSYKEQSLGLSLGLLLTRHHDFTYNLAWRTLADPSQMSSGPIRRQLGHSLLSSLKYTFKIDSRNSPLRPTQGYAFVSTSQISGLSPDHRNVRFLRQEFDLRYAIPLGFYHAALNFGVSTGVIFPWGKGSLCMSSPLPDRFFLGGNSSPVCTLGGLTSILGFKCRGLGPSAPRREFNGTGSESSGRDALGGDIAVTAFADLSFDLPLKFLREAGVHGHVFASTGNLVNITENGFWNFSLQRFRDSFRSSVGTGIIIPTKLFRMEKCCTISEVGKNELRRRLACLGSKSRRGAVTTCLIQVRRAEVIRST